VSSIIGKTNSANSRVRTKEKVRVDPMRDCFTRLEYNLDKVHLGLRRVLLI